MGKKQWNEIIYLVSVTYENDEYGRELETKKKRKVRADKSGSYASEYNAAGQNGLKLTDFMFTIQKRSYHDETIVEYKGKQYGIYRTYPPSDDLIELHLTDRAGMNGNNND